MRYVGSISFWSLAIFAAIMPNAFAQVRFTETGGGTDYIGLQAPASVPSNFTWTLPNGDGSANQCLATNGSGTLFWKTAGGGTGYSLDASDGSPVNALYVDAAGNVGIGATTPEGKLDVRGMLSAGSASTGIANPNAVIVARSMTNPHIILERVGSNTGGLTVDMTNLIVGSEIGGILFKTGINYNADYAATGTERMRISATGYVGIGTTNPVGTLDVVGGTAAASTNAAPINLFGQNASSGNSKGGSIFLVPGMATGSGNPGVAAVGYTSATVPTWAQQNTLLVNGMIYGASDIVAQDNFLIGASSAGVRGQSLSAAGQTADYMSFWANNGERMRVNGSGKMGIGTTNPQAGLDVATTGTGASAIIVPRDTTANRPSSPVNGMMRYNSTTGKFEGYENGGWVPLSSGLMGTLKYAGATNCIWNTSGTSWGNYSADNDCAAAAVTGGATAPGTKVPAIVMNSLPAGDYEVTVSGQFTLNASSNWCRWRISDGTNTSGVIATNLTAEGTSQVTGLFSYSSSGNRTFTIQALGGTANICWLSADEPGNLDLTIWVKRI
jgi:hypothetical protein